MPFLCHDAVSLSCRFVCAVCVCICGVYIVTGLVFQIMVTPKAGRVLLYRVDLWHRGTSIFAGSRRAMNVVYFRRDDPGTAGRWNAGFWKNRCAGG